MQYNIENSELRKWHMEKQEERNSVVHREQRLSDGEYTKRENREQKYRTEYIEQKLQKREYRRQNREVRLDNR